MLVNFRFIEFCTVCFAFLCLSQPLKDNLDSATYEVFEKDPVKYVSYERVRPM